MNESNVCITSFDRNILCVRKIDYLCITTYTFIGCKINFGSYCIIRRKSKLSVILIKVL